MTKNTAQLRGLTHLRDHCTRWLDACVMHAGLVIRASSPCAQFQLRRRRTSAIPLALVFSLIALSALSGCGKPAGVIFPPLSKPIVWPRSSEPTRIRFVGQLATSADLKPAIPVTQAMGEAMFGKKSIRSMLTPYALCTDGLDRLFVVDSNAQVVHVFDLKSRRYDQWRPPSSSGIAFSQPVGIAWDPDGKKLYVADSAGGRVFIFNTNGTLTGYIAAPHVLRPCGLAFDARSHRLFVADTDLHQVIVIRSDGQVVAGIGKRGIGLGEFNFPTNVAIDSQSRIYVSDSLNFRVQQFGPDFQPLRQIGRKGDLPGCFGQPKGLALDSQDHLYVVDANFEAVQIFDAGGNLLLDFGQEGIGFGEFWIPAGIFIDVRNRIWIADSYNRRVQVFDFVPEASP